MTKIYSSSHLKEIQNQCTDVYYKIFISALLRELFSSKSTGELKITGTLAADKIVMRE